MGKSDNNTLDLLDDPDTVLQETLTPPLELGSYHALDLYARIGRGRWELRAYVNNVTGFTGTIQIANTVATGNKWNINNLGLINADLVIDSGSQLYVPAGSNSFRSIAVSGAGNTENRGDVARFLNNNSIRSSCC